MLSGALKSGIQPFKLSSSKVPRYVFRGPAGLNLLGFALMVVRAQSAAGSSA